MQSLIVGFHLDEVEDWVAELDCGHNQHVRHAPPLISRIWVTSKSGRDSMLKTKLECKKCDLCEPIEKLEL